MCQQWKLPFIGIPLFGYGFMILIGFLTASFLCRREAEKRGLPKEKIMDLTVFLVLAGIVGSRIFYVIQFYNESFKDAPWYKWFAIWEGGLVFYGGFIAAFFAGWWYLWRNHLPVFKVLDTCAPFVLVGMGFGRIGCWLNGCCWGWRCTDYLPAFFNRFPRQSVVFHYHSALGFIKAGMDRTPPVQPTELFDSAHSFLIFVLLLWNLRQGQPKGVITFLFVAMYGCGRFVNEILRGDHHIIFVGLTVSQQISLFMVVFGIIGIIFMTFLGKTKNNLSVNKE